MARNTLANANATRPWQIYADLAQHLIGIARPLYAADPIGLDLKETVNAFDSTTIVVPRVTAPVCGLVGLAVGGGVSTICQLAAAAATGGIHTPRP